MGNPSGPPTHYLFADPWMNQNQCIMHMYWVVMSEFMVDGQGAQAMQDVFLSPSDAVHGALGSVRAGDVAILISKGGGTHEIVALLPALATKGVPVIAVTENADSTLGRAAEVVVPVRIEREADEFNMLATTSTMAVIAWFDAVCIALMRMTGYSREQFAVIHPGGAVGKRLLGGEK